MKGHTTQEFKELLWAVVGVVDRLPDGAEIISIELSRDTDTSCYNVAELRGKPFAEIHIACGIYENPQIGKIHKVHCVKGWSEDFDMVFYIDNDVAVFELINMRGRR